MLKADAKVATWLVAASRSDALRWYDRVLNGPVDTEPNNALRMSREPAVSQRGASEAYDWLHGYPHVPGELVFLRLEAPVSDRTAKIHQQKCGMQLAEYKELNIIAVRSACGSRI